MSRRTRLLGGLLAALLLAAACSGSSDDSAGGGDVDLGDPGDCAIVDLAVSPEKIDLMSAIAQDFNGSDLAELDDGCAFARPARQSSGAAMQLLADGWTPDATPDPQPVVWSPASSAWGAILNQRLADKGEAPMAPPSEPFMLTPHVIAMPKPMADALGYPEKEIGFADILALANSPEGWGAFGRPEWGPFRLGKTNPNFSTSGLSALIAQYYAATGKQRDLSAEDIARPEVVQFSKDVESAVVHYGDITLTFMNNLYRNDQRGGGLTYVSAVAVEEKSVIDYNLGNPDGVLQPGEEPRKPRVPLVAIYPKEGTLFSDNPYITLDAPWVSDQEREGAKAFEEFVKRPENQRKVLEYHFRPGNPAVEVGAPIVPANGVDPDEPRTTLEVPSPPVMIEMLDRWAEQRKSARVLLVMDVSGSMGDEGDPETGATKLDLAKDAAINALDEFKGEDDVGLRIFTLEIRQEEPTDWVDLVDIGPIAEQREEIATKIRSLQPLDGTPLYTVVGDSYEDMRAGYDPERINAVVVLTDGRNEDPRNTDLGALLDVLRATNEGQSTRPVRVFTIAYGGDADKDVLRQIAETTNAAAYDASDPKSISKVLTAVVSNF